jgi:hypothetical protein
MNVDAGPNTDSQFAGRSLWRRYRLLVLVLATAFFILLPIMQIPRASAHEVIFPTRFESGTHISGQFMLFDQDDGSGYQQVTLHNLYTGEKRKITSTPTYKQSASLGGSLVIWEEKSIGDSAADWDMYVYDLSSGTEKKLDDASGVRSPSTDGEYIVWEKDGNIFVHNWAKGTTLTSIVEGVQPIVSKGKVLFRSTGGLHLYNLATGASNLVAPAPGGYNISSFAFHGNAALFIARNPDKGIQYGLLRFGGTKPEIQYLSPLIKTESHYSHMEVGDHYVTWVQEDKAGMNQLMAARIDDGSTIQLTQAKPGDPVSLPFGFIGDTLIWAERYVTLKSTPLQVEKSASDAPKYTPVPTPTPVERIPRPSFKSKLEIAPRTPERIAIETQIQVHVDGQKMKFDEQPFIENGSTLVQFRPIFEKLGLQIKWDGDTRTITGSADGVNIRLQIDQPAAVVNGASVQLEVAPKIQSDVTVVPLRFVGEATGRKVVWDEKLRAVYIIDPKTEGKLLYPSGTLMYEGQLKNGKMNGKGKLYREDGSLWYDAEFVNDTVEGLGTFVQREGFINDTGDDMSDFYYVGEIRQGIPDGQGRGYTPDGDLIYEGGFKGGKYDGNGKYYVNGELIYDGDFSMNQYDGYGKLYARGYLVYEGQFKANNHHGKGKLYDTSFRHTLDYEGEFKNDQFDGHGTSWGYVGSWVNGKKEGKGKEYNGSDLLEYEGEFHNNLREGYGRLFESHDRIYEGMFKNDIPEGKGKLMDGYGKVFFEGEFIGGNAQGFDK